MLDRPKLTEVIAHSDYTLDICVDNRWLRLDMKRFLQYPAYKKLESVGYFLSVKHDNRMLYWDDMHDMHIDQILGFSVPLEQKSEK